MGITSFLSRLSAHKFWVMQFKGNFFKFGVERRGVGKVYIFQRMTGHISEMVRDRAEVTINH